MAKNRTVSNIRARYYDSAIGKWTSEDPLGFGAGDANLYRYVSNQAQLLTDPNGLTGQPLASTVAKWETRKGVRIPASGLKLKEGTVFFNTKKFISAQLTFRSVDRNLNFLLASPVGMWPSANVIKDDNGRTRTEIPFDFFRHLNVNGIDLFKLSKNSPYAKVSLSMQAGVKTEKAEFHQKNNNERFVWVQYFLHEKSYRSAFSKDKAVSVKTVFGLDGTDPNHGYQDAYRNQNKIPNGIKMFDGPSTPVAIIRDFRFQKDKKLNCGKIVFAGTFGDAITDYRNTILGPNGFYSEKSLFFTHIFRVQGQRKAESIGFVRWGFKFLMDSKKIDLTPLEPEWVTTK